MTLSAKEYRVLSVLATTSKFDYWRRIHATTVNTLTRKKFVDDRGVTATGRAALVAVFFDDLCEQGDPVPAASASRQTTALVRLKTLTNVEIDAHPLLDAEQRSICKGLRNAAKAERRPFSMLDFAEIALRATGNDYAAVTDDGGSDAAVCDKHHRRAALLYTYEAIKAGPPIIAETANERGTLRDLELLASHGLP